MILKNLITKKSNKLLIFLNDTSKKFVRVNKYFIWNKKKNEEIECPLHIIRLFIRT